MYGIGDLLLNSLCIILSIFAYDLLAGRKRVTTQQFNNIAISALGSISAILCMTFPVTMTSGVVFHLGAIPMLLAILYGGLIPGMVTWAIIVVYGTFHTGLTYDISILTLCILAAAAWTLVKRFHTAQLYTKFWLGTGLIVIEAAVRSTIIVSVRPVPSSTLPYAIVFLFVSASTFILSIYLVEYLKQNYFLRKELFQTERLRVVTELAASIAHEVRNPMTAVRGFAQLLSQDAYITEHHGQSLSIMIGELDRAHKIISDYLDFASSESNQTHTVDVSTQVRDVVQILTPYANANSVYIEENREDALYVRGNASKFYQAIMNILKNAIESMSGGGTVYVQARRLKHLVEVIIADTGDGMTEAELSRLGSPFYSTKSNGTGLGLTSTYQCIHAMNGRIEVASEKHCGTTFTVLIPLAQE